jgi:Holliday junction resolvase RusA-like endonuclease
VRAAPDLFAGSYAEPAPAYVPKAAARDGDDVLLISVPGDVRGKGRPRIGRLANGRPVAFTDKETVKYENMVAYAAKLAMESHGWSLVPAGEPLALRMVARFTPPASRPKKWQAAALNGQHRPTRKPDPDNVLKVIDALNGIVWHDDVQVVEVSISKAYALEPGLTIEVWRL